MSLCLASSSPTMAAATYSSSDIYRIAGFIGGWLIWRIGPHRLLAGENIDGKWPTVLAISSQEEVDTLIQLYFKLCLRLKKITAHISVRPMYFFSLPLHLKHLYSAAILSSKVSRSQTVLSFLCIAAQWVGQ